MSEPEQENIIGRRGYKKTGFYAGVIGIIERSDSFAPYTIVFYDKKGNRSGGVVAHRKDIELIGEAKRA